LAEETGSTLVQSPVEFLDYTIPDKPVDPEGIRIWDEGRRMTEEDAIAYVRGHDAERDVSAG
jgi:hypothetical protein